MSTILIVEDEMLLQGALAAFLGRAGHKIVVASDGEAAIGMFEGISPDVVLLDRHLPGVTGSTVLREIKNTQPNSVVLMLSAYDDPKSIERYRNMGADGFISKRVGVEVLAKIITDVISKWVEHNTNHRADERGFLFVPHETAYTTIDEASDY